MDGSERDWGIQVDSLGQTEVLAAAVSFLHIALPSVSSDPQSQCQELPGMPSVCWFCDAEKQGFGCEYLIVLNHMFSWNLSQSPQTQKETVLKISGTNILCIYCLKVSRTFWSQQHFLSWLHIFVFLIMMAKGSRDICFVYPWN